MPNYLQSIDIYSTSTKLEEWFSKIEDMNMESSL